MKYSLDTNVIISHFKADKFSDDTDRFFAGIKDFGHKIYIADIVYAEQYSDIFITWNPSDYDINIAVKTPVEVMDRSDKKA